MSSLVWRELYIFLSIPSAFSVSELSRLCLELLDTISHSHMPFFPPRNVGPRHRYSSVYDISLGTLHSAQPTLSFLLQGEVWLPGNYSWSSCGISVPEEFYFLGGFEKRLQNFLKITKKWSVEAFHCNIIQVLNLEPVRGYGTFIWRVILIFCSRKVKMDHLEFIKTLAYLVFGKRRSCMASFILWQNIILNGKTVQRLFL